MVDRQRSMNEVELIRAQLTVERQHAADVSKACARAIAGGGSPDPGAQDAATLAALVTFRQAGVDYLVSVLTRFEVREQALRELLRNRDAGRRFAAEDADQRAMEAALALPGSCRDALKNLAFALGTSVESDSAASRWMDFHRFFTGAWSARRDEIDRLFERHAKITEWRVVSDIDADSIVDERTRYARVKATLPAGIEMTPGAARP
jgi:hypothetical protein